MFLRTTRTSTPALKSRSTERNSSGSNQTEETQMRIHIVAVATTLTLVLAGATQSATAQETGEVSLADRVETAESTTVAPAAAESIAAAEQTHPPVSFEAPKDDGASFAGMNWDLGAAFATEFQALSHTNRALPNLDANGTDMNSLQEIGSGFNLAGANLNLTAELAPGVNVVVATYLSSRHHNEAWVRDGYLMLDRSPIDADVLNRVMEYVSVKVGHFELNYGDAHFRRTDNGSALQNPFVENPILDAFTSEIGGEVYGRVGPVLAMVGVTNGLNKGDVTSPDERDYAFLGKVGLDHDLGNGLRARLTGSTYQNDNAGRATLFGGDRAGSRYFNVMDNAEARSFTNGRMNPNFTKSISAYQVNPFVQYGNLELFGIVEWAQGRTNQEVEERSVDHYAVDAVYRLLDGRLYVAGRYNTFSGELYQVGSEQSVDRKVLGAGWYLNQYVLLKAEYVNQTYDAFPDANILSGGKFDGLVVQAAVAF